jgi:hypothetical protein
VASTGDPGPRKAAPFPLLPWPTSSLPIQFQKVPKHTISRCAGAIGGSVMTRMKIADLTSGVGALVLGVGLGALFPRWFGSSAGLITIAGLCMHALGMWDKHRWENPRWVVVLYWMCWLLLAAVLMMLLLIWRG